MPVKIRPEDKWFSLFIRCRDKWTCQKCGAVFRAYDEYGDNSHLKGLHNAHMFGRGDHKTRWNENNCCGLCYGCHSYLDSHPVEKIKFFIKRLGQKKFDELEKLSHELYYGWKKDAKSIADHYKKEFYKILNAN